MADDDWGNDDDLDLYGDIQAAPAIEHQPPPPSSEPPSRRGGDEEDEGRRKRARIEGPNAGPPADGRSGAPQPPPPRYPRTRAVTIFVGNLAWWTSDADLEKLFMQADVQTKNWNFAMERSCGKSKGFATAEVKDEAAADLLMSRFHKTTVHGRVIVVCMPVEEHIKTALQKNDLAGTWGEYREFLFPDMRPERDGPRDRDRGPPPRNDWGPPPGGMMGPGFMGGGFMGGGMGGFPMGGMPMRGFGGRF